MTVYTPVPLISSVRIRFRFFTYTKLCAVHVAV
jgi:hypothetical protein